MSILVPIIIGLTLTLLLFYIFFKLSILLHSKCVKEYILDKECIGTGHLRKNEYKIYNLSLKYTYNNQEYINTIKYEDTLHNLAFKDYLNIWINKNNPIMIIRINIISFILLIFIWCFCIYGFINVVDIWSFLF